MENRKRPKKKIVAVLAVIAAAALIIGYMTNVYAAKPEEDGDSLLREYPVSRGDITAGVDGSGALTIDGTPHNFTVPSTIEELYVKPGDDVKTGDKIAKLSEKAMQEKYAELETELKKAEIALENARNDKRLTAAEAQNVSSSGNAAYEQQKAEAQAGAAGLENQIAGLNAQISQMDGQVQALSAQAAELDAQLAALAEGDPQKETVTAQRDALLAEIAVLQGQLAEAREALAGAQSELAAIQGNVQAIDNAHAEQQEQTKKEQNKQNQINGIQLANGDNAIELAQIDVDDIIRQMEEIEAQMKDLYLYAQLDGIVLAVNYAVGAETTTDTPVASIGSLDEIYAVLQVPQADIGDIEEGQTVKLSFDAFPERTFTGVVQKKLPLPVKDSNPVAYQVYASLDMEGEQLLSGMTCNAQFILKQVEGVLVLSNKAIRLVDGKQVVLMQDENGELYEQPITTGFSDGRYSEILSGLQDGDIVYVEG